MNSTSTVISRIIVAVFLGSMLMFTQQLKAQVEDVEKMIDLTHEFFTPMHIFVKSNQELSANLSIVTSLLVDASVVYMTVVGRHFVVYLS
jgi:hypothetical protein